MTKDDLIRRSKRTAIDLLELELYSFFFDGTVKIVIFSSCFGDEVVISDYLLKSINAFLDYDQFEKEVILKDIYEDYKKAIKVTEYGMIPQELLIKSNNNHERANQDYFKINNPNEAYKALKIKYVSFVEYKDSDIETTSFAFLYDRPWDCEHELQLEFKNGKYIELV